MTPTPHARRRRKQLIIFAVQCALVLALGWALYQRRETLAATADVEGSDLLSLFLISVLAAPLRAIELTALTKALSARITLGESLALSQAATLLNYLPIPAGTVLRARILKRHRDLSYTRYVGLMTALIALAAAASATVGLFMLASVSHLSERVTRVVAALFSAIIAIFFLLIALPRRLPRGQGRIAERLRELLEAWATIVAKRGTVLTLFLTSAGTPLLLGLRYRVAFGALSQPVDYTESALLAAGILASMPTPVTPGSLGVREFLGGAIGTATGLDFTRVLAALALDRAMNMTHVVISGGLSLWWLRRRRLV